MKLIGSDGSPFVRKVRIVMAEKKIDYRFERKTASSPPELVQQSNPLGKVPVLVMEDGGAVFDSRVIVEYLDTVTPIHRLIPPSGRSRIEVRCWEALADGLTDAAVLIRYEFTRRPDGMRSQAWIDLQMGKIQAALAAMAKGLGEKQWCAEGRYSLADIATGCALGFLDHRFPEIDWRGRYPNLARHADRLFARPAFIETAPPPA